MGFSRIKCISIDSLQPMGFSRIKYISIDSAGPMESQGQGDKRGHANAGAMGISEHIQQQLR